MKVRMGRVTDRKGASVHLAARRRWCPVLGRPGVRITRPVGDTTPDVSVLCPWCFTSEHVTIAAREIASAAYCDERAARIERHLGVIGRAIETPAEAAAIEARIAEERAWLGAAPAQTAAAAPAEQPAKRTFADLFTHQTFVDRRNHRYTSTGRLVAA